MPKQRDQLSRADFLSQGAKAAFRLLAFGGLGTVAQAAGPTTGEDILVVVFLRGGFDALSLLPPISGPDRALYEAARPNLRIPVTGDKSALKLDDRFGLHPSAKALYELYHSGQLAIIHATGMPTSDTRSHFDAQEYMELGTPGKKTTASGWIARYLTSQSGGVAGAYSTLAALSIGNLVPTSMEGYAQVAVLDSVRGFDLGGSKPLQGYQRSALRRMYLGQEWMSRYGRDTLMTVDAIEAASPTDYKPANGVDYPKNDLGGKLRTLAQLMKMGLGVRVATIDMGGWDTHKDQANNGADGKFAGLVDQLSGSLAAFQKDLETYADRTTIVVMSEFGRRLKENANKGTDHGHGGAMLVLGKGLNGGKVYGTWPGLDNDRLYQRADLAATTDFRQVLSEVLARRGGNPHLGEIFPDYRSAKPLGLFRGGVA